MKLEKKIFLDRSDDLNAAVDAIINAPAVRVVLNIPRYSVLGDSTHTFQVLKRESETAEKELAIESIDEHILELASLAKIPALNPVFKTRERAVTDIIPRTSTRPLKWKEEKEEKPEKEEDEEERRPQVRRLLWGRRKEGKWEKKEDAVLFEEKPEKKRPRHEKRGKRFVVSFASFVALVAVGFVFVVYVLPRVTIQMSIKKTQASFDVAVAVATNVATTTVNQNAITLPGQLLTAKKNLVMSFKATGTAEQVDGSAEGTLTVFNGYSKAAQALVKNTRFESPDGKIFRSIEALTVPGAKTVDGKLQPSSIDVKVRADQPGDTYNMSATNDIWMIPGFKGTDRYQKFYATMKGAMNGGFSGTKLVPKEDDITNAKQKVTQLLQNALQAQMTLSGSDNFKLLSDASRFEIVNQTISNSTSSDGTFGVFSEGMLSELVFNEGMLKRAIMESVGIPDGENMKIDDFTLNYGTSTANLSTGKLSFAVSGSFITEPNIDLEHLKQQIAGQNESDLKTALFSLPGLERANISFWPFWVTRVPANTGKISFEVE